MRKSKLLSILLSICMVVTWMPAGVWATNEGGQSPDLIVQSNEASTHSDHPICGASCSHSGEEDLNLHEKKNWTGVSDLSKITKAGYYYLTTDVELADTWTPANDVVLCLNGKTITANFNNNAIWVQSGNFTLTDCGQGNNAGKIIHGKNESNEKYTGCGIYVGKNSCVNTFNMYGGNIIGNTANMQSSNSGGGVYVGHGSTFNMFAGNVSSNSAECGGGVYVYNRSTFNMTGGSIYNNTAINNNNSGNGGGVYAGFSSNFTMSGGNISSNSADKDGGGVYMYSGIFEMNCGIISQNTAKSTGNGGGVSVHGNASFNMSGDSSITGNTAFRGGGVHVDRAESSYEAPGNFTMSSGTINDNNATYGGGVYVSGKFTMSSGEISSNNATGKAGGVYVNDDSELEISGAPKITNNTSNNNTTSNTYLTDPATGKTGVTITISSGLSSGAKIGVTLAQGHSKTIATGASRSDLQYFYSDGGDSFILEGDNIKLSNGTTPTPEVHEHPICGKTCSHDSHDNVASWEGISDLSKIQSGTDENPNYYYLTNNVTLTTATEAPALDSSVSSWKMYYGWDAPDNVVLCLNGYDITMENPTEYTNENVDVIRITGNLTLTDCQSEQGKITHTAKSKGRGAYVLGGTFNMYGGQITGNTTQQYSGGGGVCIGGIQDTNCSSVFNLYGGSITHNTASFGGGVKVSRIVWYGPSQFNMYGGSITDNTATVTDETPNSYGVGGGVYVSWTATCKMSGGTITENTAKFDGAGVYLSALARSYESDNGKAADFEIFGSPSITGNTVNDNASNVCLDSHTADNKFETVDSSITISSALTNNANIGVTLAQGHSGIIATGASSSDLQYFRSDGGYSFVLDGNNIKLNNGTTQEHIHDWKYVANGETITATCNSTDKNCTSPNGGSITISAPTNLTYDGNAKAATLNGSISALTTTPDITYKQSGNTFSGTPTNAGTYTASITVEGVTASVTYTIDKAAIEVKSIEAISRDYEKGNKTVEVNVTFKDKSGDEISLADTDYIATGTMNTDTATGDAGENSVSVNVKLRNANYSMEDYSDTTTVKIWKLSAPNVTVKQLTQRWDDTTQKTITPEWVGIPTDAGTTNFSTINTIYPNNVITFGSDYTMATATGALSYALAGATKEDVGKVIKVKYNISMQNYMETQVELEILITDHKSQSNSNFKRTNVITKDKVTTSPAEVKTDETGTATATVTDANQKEIIKQVKDNKSEEIVINVSEKDIADAARIEINLDKEFIDFIVNDTDARLTIKTPAGERTFTKEELKNLSEASTGDTIIIDPTNDDSDDTEKIAKAKELTEKLNITARSSKTAKGNIKVVLKNSTDTKDLIKELKELGFTVKYRFYRSTRKSSGYKSTLTKDTASYTNTTGKKGNKYYYKVRVMVYDADGSLIAKSDLKQCKYAARTWSK